MSTEKVQHEYGADEIQILEGLEAVRKRPEEETSGRSEIYRARPYDQARSPTRASARVCSPEGDISHSPSGSA